ncbi:MAG: aryl-sulfate sulfotransferase [Thermoplasmatales archaeon]|nr:MAG: aryl-sulfate sulfotransferase [Thermoplasmatales archaeon]
MKKNHSEMIENINNSNKSNLLIIKDIKDGFGITYFLSNEGDETIYNITINTDATGRFIKIKSPKLIKIPELNAGQSTKIRIRLSGIGIGEPIDCYRVKVIVNADDTKTVERIILLNILGPFVKIITVFINDEDSYEGYTLFAPEYYMTTYLINNSGEIVKKWKSDYIQCAQCCLLENGNLLRASLARINPYFPGGGMTGRLEMFNWDGDLIWVFEHTNDNYCLNHGFEVLPNGNILLIAWEVKTYAEAIDAGRNPFTIPSGVLWPCYIIEVEPTFPEGGNIVWEWHVWDHLIQDYDSSKNNFGIVRNHPELIDINYGLPRGYIDMNHINSLDYNEKYDQILISSHTQDEIWIIDHSTTTEEAAGHSAGRYGRGGDLLYRWGNPQAYRAGTNDDQMLFGQHDARWIEQGYPGEGHITIFNNGLGRPEIAYSSVDEIVPPVDENGNYYLETGSTYGPKEPIWSYVSENLSDFFSPIIAGAQRLPNGNTLICNGYSGKFFEVTMEKETVWRFYNLIPSFISNQVTNINRYPLDYPGIGNFTKKLDIVYDKSRYLSISILFSDIIK